MGAHPPADAESPEPLSRQKLRSTSTALANDQTRKALRAAQRNRSMRSARDIAKRRYPRAWCSGEANVARAFQGEPGAGERRSARLRDEGLGQPFEGSAYLAGGRPATPSPSVLALTKPGLRRRRCSNAGLAVARIA